MSSTHHAWAAVRACLQSFGFYDIKAVAGLAGLDLVAVAHLEQKPEKGATKGQLMTAIDAAFGKMSEVEKLRFLAILAEEILRRKPEAESQLSEYLSRLGWAFVEGTLVPLNVFSVEDLPEFPEKTRGDFLKAVQRFRDNDLSGAINAACGAVDTATAAVYEQANLGDPSNASFQERCKRSAAAKGVVPLLEDNLRALGWPDSEIVPFKKNFEGALTQGAYVMQTLRSKMGDVHGTKPISKPLVFDCLKWAELLVRSLTD